MPPWADGSPLCQYLEVNLVRLFFPSIGQKKFEQFQVLPLTNSFGMLKTDLIPDSSSSDSRPDSLSSLTSSSSSTSHSSENRFDKFCRKTSPADEMGLIIAKLMSFFGNQGETAATLGDTFLQTFPAIKSPCCLYSPIGLRRKALSKWGSHQISARC